MCHLQKQTAQKFLNMVQNRDMTTIMGFLNDRVAQISYTFTKADGTSQTTLIIDG